mgnify:CR=1
RRFPRFLKDNIEFTYPFLTRRYIENINPINVRHITKAINHKRHEILNCINKELLINPDLKFASITFSLNENGKITYSYFNNGSYKGVECVFKTMD